MNRNVRIGVVGTSWWAQAMHLPSLASHPRAELVAISGRNVDKASELAATYGIPAVYGDYRAMLDAGGLDAVVVVTPDDLHYEVTLAAIDRGIHVLCEKPLALTAGQAAEMLGRAERAGVKHMVAFSWRGLPHYRYLRELVGAGFVGRPSAAQLSYLTGGGARGSYSWRYDRSRSTGALGNYGAHMIDLARWLLGDIVGVSAHLATRVERPGPGGPLTEPANDQAVLTVEFAGGAVGTIQASEVAQTGERFHEHQIRLYGDAGTLEADLSLAVSGRQVCITTAIRGVRRGEAQFRALPVPPELLGDADPGALFDPFTKHPVGDRLFVDAILADRSPAPSFRDGLHVQVVMDAAQAAHSGRRWVPVRMGARRPAPQSAAAGT